MVGNIGVEPMTSSVSERCSNHWANYLLWSGETGLEPATRAFNSYFSIQLRYSPDGCGDRIRTYDLRVMSPMSCHCSTPRYWYSLMDSNHRLLPCKRRALIPELRELGDKDWIWTNDTRLFKSLLYHAELLRRGGVWGFEPYLLRVNSCIN